MNTNEDNYFNYTVLSFTYILFSKLLMHIYKISCACVRARARVCVCVCVCVCI